MVGSSVLSASFHDIFCGLSSLPFEGLVCPMISLDLVLNLGFSVLTYLSIKSWSRVHMRIACWVSNVYQLVTE